MGLESFLQGRGGPGGWVLLPEPELHLSGEALVPDMAGWRRERMPEMPLVPAFTLVPDWVCEVRSPSTEALNRGRGGRATPARVWATCGGWLRCSSARGLPPGGLALQPGGPVAGSGAGARRAL